MSFLTPSGETSGDLVVKILVLVNLLEETAINRCSKEQGRDELMINRTPSF